MEPATPDVEESLEAGNVTLHVEHFRAGTQPPAWVMVFVHGYSSHCAIYRHVAAALAKEGVAVTTFDCRGHGRSLGRRGHVSAFQEFHADLALVIARARALHPGVPLALMGHSHGGLVVLDHALDRSAHRPDRLIAVTPQLALALRVPGWKRVAGRVMGRIWPTLAMGNELRAADISRNPLVVENFGRDPLVHHVATARWFVEMLAAQTRVRAGAASLTVPTLLLVAGDDRIVLSAAAVAFAHAAGPMVELRNYPGLYHELFLEPEHGEVVKDLVAWLRAPLRELDDLDRPTETVPSIIRSPP